MFPSHDRKALLNELKRYGNRTKDGDKKGLDTKSLSHALRVLCELKELVTTKNITFPLQDADFIKQVKVGDVSDEQTVITLIDFMFEECMDLLEKSDLPDEGSVEGMLKELKSFYE